MEFAEEEVNTKAETSWGPIPGVGTPGRGPPRGTLATMQIPAKLPVYQGSKKPGDFETWWKKISGFQALKKLPNAEMAKVLYFVPEGKAFQMIKHTRRWKGSGQRARCPHPAETSGSGPYRAKRQQE